MRRSWPAVLAVLLAACGGTEGGGPAGGGGSGGEGDPGGAGGGPGIPVALSWIEFEARSMVLGQSFGNGPSPFPAHRLVIDEEPGGCASVVGATIGPRPHQIQVFFDRLAPGDCTVGPVENPACRATVLVEPGGGRGFGVSWIFARAGVLRIDATDGTHLSGELRVELPVDPEQAIASYSSSSGEAWELCRSVGGRTRECTPPAGSSTCCNEGRETETLVVPVEATLCREAVGCAERPCGIPAALDCPALEAPPCVEACAPIAEVCADCWACDEESEPCVRYRDEQCGQLTSGCLSRCEEQRRLPTVAHALGCLAQAGTCTDLRDCIAADPVCEAP